MSAACYADHHIGKGTRNQTVNMPEDEWRIWGQLAFNSDRSSGDLLREAALRGLRQMFPAEAAKIEEVRRKRQQMLMAVIGSGLILFATLQGQDIRRARVVRSARNGRVEEVA